MSKMSQIHMELFEYFSTVGEFQRAFSAWDDVREIVDPHDLLNITDEEYYSLVQEFASTVVDEYCAELFEAVRIEGRDTVYESSRELFRALVMLSRTLSYLDEEAMLVDLYAGDYREMYRIVLDEYYDRLLNAGRVFIEATDRPTLADVIDFATAQDIDPRKVEAGIASDEVARVHLNEFQNLLFTDTECLLEEE